MKSMEMKFSEAEQKELEEAGVSALVLFGSHARDMAGPMSDYDFGLLLKNHKDYYNEDKRREIYDVVYDLLASKIKKLVDIDIVFLSTAPMELQAHVMKYGIPLYEKDVRAFPRFRERVIKLYSDFAPLRKMFHEAVMSRIP